MLNFVFCLSLLRRENTRSNAADEGCTRSTCLAALLQLGEPFRDFSKFKWITRWINIFSDCNIEGMLFFEAGYGPWKQGQERD